MKGSPLISFWIIPPEKNGPLGFGVTAFSLTDALGIISKFGYDLPDDVNQLQVIEDVKVSELDHKKVVPRMGPIAVRGLWYPFTKVGI